MPKIGLSMIVKNEAEIITTCLDSVKPLIDYALICDTGSDDGTQQIIQSWFDDNDMACEIIDEPWVSFSHNRSMALAALRESTETFDLGLDYALIIDADDTLKFTIDPEILKEKMTADCYSIAVHHGILRHNRAQFCKLSKPFVYRGVVHEFLHCDEQFDHLLLPGVSLEIGRGGNRARNADVYRDDAKLLEDALAQNADPDLRPRYTFYLAQSYRDSNQLHAALERYRERAGMGGWPEEVYMSLLNVGRLHERLNHPLERAIKAYKEAIKLVPDRAEAYHGAARACRLADMFAEGYQIASDGIRLPIRNGLFIEPWIYQYGLLDEFAICAYYARDRLASWLACRVLLQVPELDQVTRERVERNAAFSLKDD